MVCTRFHIIFKGIPSYENSCPGNSIHLNESALSLMFLSKPRQVFYPLLAYLPEKKMHMKQSQSFV